MDRDKPGHRTRHVCGDGAQGWPACSPIHRTAHERARGLRGPLLARLGQEIHRRQLQDQAGLPAVAAALAAGWLAHALIIGLAVAAALALWKLG